MAIPLRLGTFQTQKPPKTAILSGFCPSVKASSLLALYAIIIQFTVAQPNVWNATEDTTAHHFHSNSYDIADNKYNGAVSVRSIRGPNAIGKKPAERSVSASVLDNPPSGPNTASTV